MDAKDQRTALRRLQESGVGVIVPVAELKAKPVPNAIALFTPADVPAVRICIALYCIVLCVVV